MAAEYSELVLKHFDAPQNCGPLPAGEGSCIAGAGGSREAGVFVRFEARVVSGRIAAIVFRAFGCPHVIAACSLATLELSGQPVTALAKLSATALAEALQAPPDKLGRLLQVEDALRKCAQAWDNTQLSVHHTGAHH